MDEIGFVLALVAVIVWFFLPAALFASIFRKAGYSGYWGLIMLVPLANVLWLVAFSAMRWPIERELSRLRRQLGVPEPADYDAMVSEAASLDRSGEWDQAVALYQKLIDGQTPHAEYAANCIAEIERKKANAGL